MERGHDMVIQISSSTIVKSILFVLLFVLLYLLRDLVLIVLTAVVIASSIEPAVHFFTVYRIPRVIAVLLVYLIIICLLLGLFYFFLPPLISEVANFASTLPQYLDSVQSSTPLLDNPLFPFFSNQLSGGFSVQDVVSGVEASLSNAAQGLFQTITTVFGGVLSFIFIVVFSFYFAMQETGVDDFLKVVTPVKNHAHILDLWRRSQRKIGLWMQGQLILGLVVGVLVYLFLAILGVKYALTLALFAAIFELIPVFGPILAAVPAVIVALGTGGTSLAVWVILVYIIIQQFENHLIYPLVVTKVVGVPPLLVILALIVGMKLAGFLGIILSVPAAAIIQEFVVDLQRRRQSLGDSIQHS